MPNRLLPPAAIRTAMAAHDFSQTHRMAQFEVARRLATNMTIRYRMTIPVTKPIRTRGSYQFGPSGGSALFRILLHMQGHSARLCRFPTAVKMESVRSYLETPLGAVPDGFL